MIAVSNITGHGGITEYTNRILLDDRFTTDDTRTITGSNPGNALIQYHHTACELPYIERVMEYYEATSIVLHDQHFENLLPDLITEFRYRIVLTEALKARVPDATFLRPPCMDKAPTVVGFGAWRNNHDRNREACRKAGVEYTEITKWLSSQQFEINLRQADGVILSYCEADAICWPSSLAAALATHKPVFLSNVRHFVDAPSCSSVFKHETEEQLVAQLEDAFRMPYMREHQWHAHINDLYNLLK